MTSRVRIMLAILSPFAAGCTAQSRYTAAPPAPPAAAEGGCTGRGAPTAEQGLVAANLAALDGDAERVRQLLDAGAGLDASGRPESLLLRNAAAMRGGNELQRTKLVALLIERGVDPNAEDSNGRTALYYAAYACNDRVVGLLLSKGADPMAGWKGFTPLHNVALGFDRTGEGRGGEIARLLIAAGAQVNAVDQTTHSSPLHVVAYRGNAEVAAVLIQHGASLSSLDNRQRTPLDIARSAGNSKMVELLEAALKAKSAPAPGPNSTQ